MGNLAQVTGKYGPMGRGGLGLGGGGTLAPHVYLLYVSGVWNLDRISSFKLGVYLLSRHLFQNWVFISYPFLSPCLWALV
jgi:hypothetical protein